MNGSYLYIKSLHIIFIVTWFAGLFYMPRLLIYNTECNDLPDSSKVLLQSQFSLMMGRLWMGITWPSAILTLALGPSLWWIMGTLPNWLMVKLIFVAGLYAYHLSIHRLYKEQQRGIFRYTSQQLRWWNEVATIFLVSIVMLAVVKNSLSWIWATGGLVILIVVLTIAIKVYKKWRSGR